MKHTKYTITVPADKSSQSPERQLRRDNENAVSTDTGSVCSALKFSRQGIITVFALIGMLLVFAPSHLRADEIKIMSKAFQMDDYVIVEPLLDNLSLNNEWKTSMESAEELEKDCPTEMTVETFLKYVRGKGRQTKLFGRITASLLEPPKRVEQVIVFGVPFMR